jgi:hypothetical protein
MSVGFGFSTGDFIAALQLVSTVIDALQDSGKASTQFRELARQLYSLEAALQQVKRLELHESHHYLGVALKQAAAQCHRTIDDFWKDAAKYQPYLSGTEPRDSAAPVKAAWRKIKWAVCKPDDVAKFKADLVGHTEAIHILLTSVHMYVQYRGPQNLFN